MSRRDYDDFEHGSAPQGEWPRKTRHFLRYLSTRKMECWGFFAAGFLVATIF